MKGMDDAREAGFAPPECCWLMAESQRPRRRRLLSARGVEDVDQPALAGKGELAAAALADRERRHRSRCCAQRGSGRFDSVLEMFDRVASALRAASFAGCPFVDARLEVRDPAHPAAEVGRQHKARIAEELGERLQNEGVARPRRFARTLLYLLDGATVH